MNILSLHHSQLIIILLNCAHTFHPLYFAAAEFNRNPQPYMSEYNVPGIDLKESSFLLEVIRGELNEIQSIVGDSLRFRNEPSNFLFCCPPFNDKNFHTGQVQVNRPAAPSTAPRKSRPPNEDSVEKLKKPILYSSFHPESFSECGLRSGATYRIIGGTSSTPGAWPWIANLGYASNTTEFKFSCGGSLISSQHVLTAAHCVHGRKNLKIVRLGEHDLTTDNDGANPINLAIAKKTIHPGYMSGSTLNDIAILKLDRTLKFSDDIRPICLPEADNFKSHKLVGTSSIVAGWGSTHFGSSPSSILRETRVDVVDTEKCRKSYNNIIGAKIDDTVICAGDTTNDACQGDSGGPLMASQNSTFYLIGIVSTGLGCAEDGYPGIYTRVTSFLDFIKSNLDESRDHS